MTTPNLPATQKESRPRYILRCRQRTSHNVNYKPKRILNEQKLDIFMDLIRRDEIWYEFFYIELMTGLRRGEIYGLMRQSKKRAVSQWIFPNPVSPELPMSPDSAYRKLKVLLKLNRSSKNGQ